MRLLQQIAEASNETSSEREALERSLRVVGELTGWPVGHAFVLDRDTKGLVATGIWHLADGECFEPLVEATNGLTVGVGDGLPGLALSASTPIWTRHRDVNDALARKSVARSLGLGSGVAVPVLVRPGDRRRAGVLHAKPQARRRRAAGRPGTGRHPARARGGAAAG